MKQAAAGMLFFCTITCMASVTFASGNAHWDYSTGHSGPEGWGALDPAYEMCGKGKNQSPVDIAEMVEADLPFIKIDYQVGGSEVINNGHTIQVNYQPGSTITVSGNTFELKQFHFHSPSENVIKGQPWPLEAHFVHADAMGNLAVIAVMYRPGDENAELEKAWSSMPENAGDSAALASVVDANKLLPDDKDYYRFNGSLTTPPCSEGVLWLVMKDDSTVSVEQVEKFSHTMHHPNNRPVQPRNARLIMK